MQKYRSTQFQTTFLKLKAPVVIDMSSQWGEGNLQNFPNGVFLKVVSGGEVSHGVQPNEDFSAPVGWEPTIIPNLYRKKGIFAQFCAGKGTISVTTLDGEMKHELPGYICYNIKEDNNPDFKDSWFQKVETFEKNYEKSVDIYLQTR